MANNTTKSSKYVFYGKYILPDDGKDHTPVYTQGVDKSNWAKPVVSTRTKMKSSKQTTYYFGEIQ